MNPNTAQTLCQVGTVVFSILVIFCGYGSFHFGRVVNNNPARQVSRDPDTHRTPLYVRTKALIDQRTQYLITEKVDPWLMIHTGKMKPIVLHSGQTCRYSGIKYEGSPKLVFWESLIEPFLEEEIRDILDSVGKECVDNNIDAGVPLDEAAMLLQEMANQVYNRMAYVDQRLRTAPTQQEKAPRKDVRYGIDKINKYVNEHAEAAKALYSKLAN